MRAAPDSSPLWGAGRVEDTGNLLGHALRKALGVIARQQGRGLTEPITDAVAALATQAGAPVLGGSSLKRCWILTGTTRVPGTMRWAWCWRP